MSADFRKIFLRYLNRELNNTSLRIPRGIDDPQSYYGALCSVPWVVHSSPPGKNGNAAEHILRYLSRYVAKTAVNDRRIHTVENGWVHLKYYDRKKFKPFPVFAVILYCLSKSRFFN